MSPRHLPIQVLGALNPVVRYRVFFAIDNHMVDGIFSPPTHLAFDSVSEAEGLLAVGGSLTPDHLHAAYHQGIYPWFGLGQPVMWWAPNPRMVLPVECFKFNRSLKKTIQRLLQEARLVIRIDHDFTGVIKACATVARKGQAGTWIVPQMQKAYNQWHQMGGTNQSVPSQPHSFETWIDGELSGGLYGVNMGRMFFGESMFALRSDASKIALAALVCFCMHHAIDVIDCQQKTQHLGSLGALLWPKQRFESHLLATVDMAPPTTWVYDASMWQALFSR